MKTNPGLRVSLPQGCVIRNNLGILNQFEVSMTVGQNGGPSRNASPDQKVEVAHRFESIGLPQARWGGAMN
jgi:hypothetical protein